MTEPTYPSGRALLELFALAVLFVWAFIVPVIPSYGPFSGPTAVVSLTALAISIGLVVRRWLKSHTPPRRFRYSLRTLFVVVTVAAAIAWLLRPKPPTIVENGMVGYSESQIATDFGQPASDQL